MVFVSPVMLDPKSPKKGRLASFGSNAEASSSNHDRGINLSGRSRWHLCLVVPLEVGKKGGVPDVTH